MIIGIATTIRNDSFLPTFRYFGYSSIDVAV